MWTVFDIEIGDIIPSYGMVTHIHPTFDGMEFEFGGESVIEFSDSDTFSMIWE